MSTTIPTPAPAAAPAAEAAIDATGVVVAFPRRKSEALVALDGLDLQVHHGEVLCLLGPNGSGKTTLLNVLTGLLRPTSGRVRVLGLDPVRDRKGVLARIALVPQETAIYPELTARENLLFHGAYYGLPAAETRTRAAEALDLVQLTARGADRAGTFSGGMQRRLALARALMMHPQVLLLDEPTLGVDVQSRSAIWARIREIADSGCSVLLTTNYMEEAEALGDRISIIDHGRNVVHGNLADLTEGVPVPERPARASLQDVFLMHTGRELRD